MLKSYLSLFLVTSALGYECDQHAMICETSLYIYYKLPMMTEEGPVFPYKGKIYHYNVTDTSNATPIDVSDVITADGWENSYRLVAAVNGTLPGPSIIVYEGQTVMIHVKNLLFSEVLTIHWHGVYMKATPWMDGTPFITQCPILPGQTFTYMFTARPVGTFWYHSHVGHQRLNGLFGAFVIRKKELLPMDEHIMQVFEWNHDYDANTDDVIEDMGGLYKDRKQFPPSIQLNGLPYTVYSTHSGLINGRGRFWEINNTHNDAPLEVFRVMAGKKYLFRVIATGAIFTWRISVDQHNLTVVSVDASDIEPVVAESFIISPGERYNFILEANQPVGNYWIRAETLDRRFMKKGEAVLNYDGVMLSEPTSKKTICTATKKCLVVNCPFPFYPENNNINCTDLTALRTKLNIATPHPVKEIYKEYFLNFAFPGENGEEGPPSINGKIFKHPVVSALTQPNEITDACADTKCGEGKLCECVNTLLINPDDTIQMTFLNMGKGRVDDHPVHMHGHAFMVLKIGYGVYNDSNGAFIRDSDDINCRGNTELGGSMCNNATWTNSSWLNGNIPNLIQWGAIHKDTVIVPSGGYVVIRFVATTPGLWLLHCHIDMHSNGGMAMILNESFAHIPKPPVSLPKCGNFYIGKYENEERKEISDDGQLLSKASSDAEIYNLKTFWIVVVVMIMVILIQFIVMVLICRRRHHYQLGKDGQTNKAFVS